MDVRGGFTKRIQARDDSACSSAISIPSDCNIPILLGRTNSPRLPARREALPASPHLPHPRSFRPFSEVFFLLDYPEIIDGVAAASGKGPYVINLMLVRIEHLAL